MAQHPARNLAVLAKFQEIPEKLDLTLAAGITLVGTVRNKERTPLPDAAISLQLQIGRFNYPLNVPPGDAKGSLSIPALPQGFACLLRATVKGYGGANASLPLAESRADRYEVPPFVLKRADHKVAGQVLGPDDKPVPGATVRLGSRLAGAEQLGGANGVQVVKTDSTGHFVCEGLVEGDIHLIGNWGGSLEAGATPTVLASPSGRTPVVQAGDTNIILRLVKVH